MQVPIFQLDAFASELFSGNPAAVVLLPDWVADRTMQAIAAENALSETAFVVGRDGRFEIRWFTPAVEVDLCGHATLAAARVLFDDDAVETGDRIAFESPSGPLCVERRGPLLAMDFPARPPKPVEESRNVAEALGAEPEALYEARDLMAVFRDQGEIAALSPDLEAVAALPTFAVIATAPGARVDFVSRFFAPQNGVPEDPVTGSAHCTLVPYWAERLGRARLHALQISPRGGELFCELRGERVEIAGHAALYLRGEIQIP